MCLMFIAFAQHPENLRRLSQLEVDLLVGLTCNKHIYPVTVLFIVCHSVQHNNIEGLLVQYEMFLNFACG